MSIKSVVDRIKELFTLNKSIIEKKEEFEKIIAEKEAELEKINLDIKQSQDKVQLITAEKNRIEKERNNEILKTKEQVERTINSYKKETNEYKNLFIEAQNSLDEINKQIDEQNKQIDKQDEKIKFQKSKLKLIRSLQNKLLDLITYYSKVDIDKLPQLSSDERNNLFNELSPSLELPLHSFDVKSLKTLSKENNKLIENTLSRYEKRYTTKSNKAIYQLMVIALRAELQNIMIGMKFNTIDKCKSSFNNMINKYLQIASDGNQSIAPTLNTFISEIETLFEKSIDIEYEYYIKKEQERAEQQALKEKMRQEAEERKELERQQKLVEKEETKFKTEIENTQEQINSCQDDELLLQLKEKIKQLEERLQTVETKKEEIINLQNGKAGYVYIISNLGSFGNNRFKIGMTRRINPLDRINELGSASVPFKFDVHSFIFSDNAVELEHSLHTHLSEKRTNKVNLRKEFFDIPIDELESLVQELDPTAEFSKTMLAAEYRQSIAIQKENNKEIIE